MRIHLVPWLVGATSVLWGGIGFSQQAPPLSPQIAIPQQAQLNDLNTAGSTSPATQPESGFFTSWDNRVRDTLAQQPSWTIPLVTASSGLIQVFRYDFVRQITPQAPTL